VLVLAVRAGLPRELYELAAVEGAGPWRVLTGITLPLLAPALVLLLLRDTIFSFQLNFVPALILTDGRPPPYATTYLPLFVYRNGFEYLRYGYAAALLLFALTLRGRLGAVAAAAVLAHRRGRLGRVRLSRRAAGSSGSASARARRGRGRARAR
jgi:ABC-type sugar transport system permease subunit